MFCNIYVKKMCQKWVPKIPKKLILPYKLLYCMKFQIPLFPHPLADFFCSRVIFWDKISYFKRGKGADVLENYALEPKMVQMTQEFRMWGMAGHKRPWWLQMAGSTLNSRIWVGHIQAGGLVTVGPTEIAPGGRWGG